MALASYVLMFAEVRRRLLDMGLRRTYCFCFLMYCRLMSGTSKVN